MHQNREKIKILGFEIEKNVGIKFEYYDYRNLTEESREIVTKKRIYKQKFIKRTRTGDHQR